MYINLLFFFVPTSLVKFQLFVCSLRMIIERYQIGCHNIVFVVITWCKYLYQSTYNNIVFVVITLPCAMMLWLWWLTIDKGDIMLRGGYLGLNAGTLCLLCSKELSF